MLIPGMFRFFCLVQMFVPFMSFVVKMSAFSVFCGAFRGSNHQVPRRPACKLSNVMKLSQNVS